MLLRLIFGKGPAKQPPLTLNILRQGPSYWKPGRNSLLPMGLPFGIRRSKLPKVVMGLGI
jgi:hypothetical protein